MRKSCKKYPAGRVVPHAFRGTYRDQPVSRSIFVSCGFDTGRLGAAAQAPYIPAKYTSRFMKSATFLFLAHPMGGIKKYYCHPPEGHRDDVSIAEGLYYKERDSSVAQNAPSE